MIDNSSLEKKLRKKVIDATVEYYESILKHKRTFVSGDKINYAGRIFDEKEMCLLVDSSLDFWLTSGRYANKFEKALAQFLKVKFCSLTNSGSSSNLLAFQALTIPGEDGSHIRKGDEVITVAAGFPTTVAPIVQFGAVPVFVDVTLPTYNVDCDALEAALSSKTRALMLAHTLGNPFEIDRIKEFCKRHSLWLIEDNCDALGSRYLLEEEWQYTGTFGDIGTSSFYPPHHITTGEGGAVYTNNRRLRKNVLSLRDWGRDCWCDSGTDDTCHHRFSQQFGELPFGYDHKYVYSNFGYNLKLTEMQAAIGCAQIDKLPGFTEQRKQNWQYLKDKLGCYEDVFVLPEKTVNSDPSWFGFPLTVKANSFFTRDEIVAFLEENNIQTRMLFAGNIVRQPCFNEMRQTNKGFRVVGGLESTDNIMRNTFWIGVFPGLCSGQLEYIVDTFTRFFDDKKHSRTK